MMATAGVVETTAGEAAAPAVVGREKVLLELSL
jgi:hypothetical protein